MTHGEQDGRVRAWHDAEMKSGGWVKTGRRTRTAEGGGCRGTRWMRAKAVCLRVREGA